MLARNTVYCGSCLELMPQIESNSIDMVLCDLPYGVTACEWDVVIPLEPLWAQYTRIVRPEGAIILTATQPFTSLLVMSNLAYFRYEWIWEKSKASNFLQAKRCPLKAHENILVFSKSKPPYYPVMGTGTPFLGAGRSKKGSKWSGVNAVKNPTYRRDNSGTRYPRSVQYFPTAESEKVGALHPAMKPVALFEYLIRTYTQEGATVLDNCAGSGTTGVAALLTSRNYILIEKDPNYFEVCKQRLASVTREV